MWLAHRSEEDEGEEGKVEMKATVRSGDFVISPGYLDLLYAGVFRNFLKAWLMMGI